MASLILLGYLYPQQWKLDGDPWTIDDIRYCDSPIAFIAKGNIIEGVEAKS